MGNSTHRTAKGRFCTTQFLGWHCRYFCRGLQLQFCQPFCLFCKACLEQPSEAAKGAVLQDPHSSPLLCYPDKMGLLFGLEHWSTKSVGLK